jgi:hypothetical protein
VSRFIYHYPECHSAECHYAECRYAECHYAECHYAECHYAECHYAECRSATLMWRSIVLSLPLIQHSMVRAEKCGIKFEKEFQKKINKDF